MNLFKDAMNDIVSAAEAAMPQVPGDYIGPDGLLHCRVCGHRKRRPITLDFGAGPEEHIVPVICKCIQDANERAAKAKAARDAQERIDRLKRISLMDETSAGHTFDAFRPQDSKILRLARNYVNRFSEMYAKNQGLIFYGPPGTGKTFTAACIANALLKDGVPTAMTSFVRLLSLFSGRDDEDEATQIMRLNSARLLVIDDLGAERDTSYAAEKVYNILDSRYRAHKPMILTTNLTLEEMKTEKAIAKQRLYDRVFETCYPVSFAQEAKHRLEKARDRNKDMQSLWEE